MVICTQSIVWTWGTPRRVLSLSLQGGKVNSGHWTKSGVESRPLRSPNSNSSLFFGGKDRQLTSMYPQDRQSSNLSGLVWTDSLSYFQSAVLALPWIERLLARGRTILEELKLVKLTFCSPSSSFGSSEPLRAPPPFALGPSWVGDRVNLVTCVSSNFTYPSYVYVLKIC